MHLETIYEWLASNFISTYDFGVAITFEQECCSHFNDPKLIMASLEYVGQIEEKLELNYGRFQTVVFLCNWVVANYEVRCDEYGFTLVNLERLISLSIQSFAFPMYVKQMFFAEDVRSPRNWKAYVIISS